MIVDSKAAVTLVGGGVVPPGALERARRLAPGLVAADGGADTVLAAGQMPAAVIGDFDSITAAARAAIPADRLHPIAEQETTDFDKCLSHVAAPLVIGLGFLGARVDHQLAALNTLARHPQRACLLLGAEDVVLLCPPELRLDLAPGTRVSLFPMAPVGARSEGLEWPTNGLCLAPDGRVGTSNRATGPVRIRPDAPALLVILPERCLEAAVQAVLDAPCRWPAP